VKIAFWQIHSATALGNKRVTVVHFSARIVDLESRAAGNPHGRDSGVVQGGAELVESELNLPAKRYQGVDGAIKNGRRLQQARTPREQGPIVSNPRETR
jgi:hypothetical protein